MEQIVILPATIDERHWAARLLSTSEPWVSLGVTEEKTQLTLHDPAFQVFIAHQKNKACGVLIIDPRGVAGSPYIKSIAVSEKSRNLGIGASLINYAEESCKNGSRYIFLCVSAFNTKARSFYKKLGYTEVGELKDYLIDGASEILMSKRLS
jgi:[ribosomal protein S18]-alanine N-acetyltransferase